jgi:hypothetical protein
MQAMPSCQAHYQLIEDGKSISTLFFDPNHSNRHGQSPTIDPIHLRELDYVKLEGIFQYITKTLLGHITDFFLPVNGCKT